MAEVFGGLRSPTPNGTHAEQTGALVVQAQPPNRKGGGRGGFAPKNLQVLDPAIEWAQHFDKDPVTRSNEVEPVLPLRTSRGFRDPPASPVTSLFRPNPLCFHQAAPLNFRLQPAGVLPLESEEVSPCRFPTIPSLRSSALRTARMPSTPPDRVPPKAWRAPRRTPASTASPPPPLPSCASKSSTKSPASMTTSSTSARRSPPRNSTTSSASPSPSRPSSARPASKPASSPPPSMPPSVATARPSSPCPRSSPAMAISKSPAPRTAITPSGKASTAWPNAPIVGRCSCAIRPSPTGCTAAPWRTSSA